MKNISFKVVLILIEQIFSPKPVTIGTIFILRLLFILFPSNLAFRFLFQL